jgi:hypothetical protein
MDILTEEAREITHVDNSRIKLFADLHSLDPPSVVLSKVCNAAEALLLKRILSSDQPPALKSIDITPSGLGVKLDVSNPKNN